MYRLPIGRYFTYEMSFGETSCAMAMVTVALHNIPKLTYTAHLKLICSLQGKGRLQINGYAVYKTDYM